MQTRKKIPGLALLLSALVFAGCLQDQIASGPAQPRMEKNEDPNIALLTNSGFKAEYITLGTEGNGDTAYYIEEPVSAEKAKQGYASVRIAFRKKVLDNARAQAQLSKEEQAKRYTSRNSVEKIALPEQAKANPPEQANVSKSLTKSAQNRFDHNTLKWDVKALTEVHQIKVYIQQVGTGKLGPNWVAGIRAAMNTWNDLTGTHVSFVETTNPNDCDVHIKGQLSASGGVTTWLTPDPWVEKDSVEIFFNIGFETVFPHNQKVAFAMNGFGYILNIVHTNNTGATWNGGTWVNIAGTPNGDASSIFQTSIGPTVVPAFSYWDQQAIRQMYPINGSMSIGGASDWLWTAAWEHNTQLATYVSDYVQIGDTLLYQTYSPAALWMRVGTTSPAVQIHGNTISAFQANGQYIVVRRNNGDVYARPLPGTSASSSWSYKTNIGSTTPFRLSGDRFVYLQYPGYYLLKAYNLATGSNWTEWSGGLWDFVEDFQLEGSRLFFTNNGDVWEKDLQVPNLTMAWNSYGGSYWSSRIQVSNSHVAIHTWYGSGLVYTRPLWGGGWTWAQNEVWNPQHFDLCGDKVAVASQDGFYLTLRNLTSGVSYASWYSVNGSAASVRLSGPFCDYVTKINSDGAVMAKYSITDATDYFQYAWGTKLFQRP